jgi:hypothetical protein
MPLCSRTMPRWMPLKACYRGLIGLRERPAPPELLLVVAAVGHTCMYIIHDAHPPGDLRAHAKNMRGASQCWVLPWFDYGRLPWFEYVKSKTGYFPN